MRYKMILFTVVSAIFWFSCNFPGIFDSNNQNDAPAQNTYSEKVLLVVKKTGGIAGIYNKLIVYQNGVASFENLSGSNEKSKIQLSQSELDSLDSLITANQFYELAEEYTEPQVADAFYYLIYYKNNGDSNLVFTDDFASPTRLKNVIAELEALIEKVRNNGLNFSLEVNKSSFQVGDSVVFKFAFQNISDDEIKLNFYNGQIYNFSVYTAGSIVSGRDLVWSWASNKGFTQALWTLALQPDEVREFEVTWNGTNNEGSFVTGEFEVQATLVSVPGGSSGLKTIRVDE